MTTTKILLVTLALTGLFGTGQAFAAPAQNEKDQLRACFFIAELGGYRCLAEDAPQSLVDTGASFGSAGKPPFTIQLQQPILNIPIQVKIP